MILQPRGSDLLAIRQPDHARLAADIARAWGDQAPERPEPWEAVEGATRCHDDGWAVWEEAPRLAPDGRPLDFLTTPVRERIEVYRRCVELAVGENLHVGLLVSMHVTGLFLGRYEPGAERAVDALAMSDRKLVGRFVREQEGWRARNRAWPGLWTEYRLLQLFDRLSLMLCLCPVGEVNERLERVPAAGGELHVQGQTNSLVLDPSPRAKPVSLVLEARRLSSAHFDDADSYHHALASAPIERLRFKLEARGSVPSRYRRQRS